ncbi:hypothetical protein CALCODRAFT_541741 [Calocera cornea HHB12733]|uniref:DUF6570 domain-containing protein n=1 Tax=Calocera cornea HHB12733 TaxID=1353952 RepID=A0A165G1D8_9BASI|nr:hypothetical protein CALCODRAFT_541741 [Calocera cornea HHB12733]
MTNLSTLKKSFIIHALPHVDFPRSARRSKAKLLECVEKLDASDIAKLWDAADEARSSETTRRVEARDRQRRARREEERQRRKRKRDDRDEDDQRRRRRIIDEDGRSTGWRADDTKDIQRFMRPPTEEDLRKCETEFLMETGNDALATATCCSCSGEFFRREMEHMPFESIPNSHQLVPRKPHPAHHGQLRDGKLVSIKAIHGGSIWLCEECERDLKSDRRPSWSLANDMWIGETPIELEVLTLSEQLLISHHYPRVFQFKMYPKRKRFMAGGDPDSIARGMRGNVITFAINQEDIVNMIEGGKFPRPMLILSTVIAVSFIGLMKMEEVRKRWIEKTFSVRRKVVWKALHWLKRNNRYYHQIELDDSAFWSRIDALPEDGVPIEILANIREEDRSLGADIEDDSYNPERVENDQDLDNDNVVPIRNIGVEDLDMTKATQMEILIEVLQEIRIFEIQWQLPSSPCSHTAKEDQRIKGKLSIRPDYKWSGEILRKPCTRCRPSQLTI